MRLRSATLPVSILVAILLAVLRPALVSAAIPDLDWEPSEVVDAPVSDVPPSSGVSGIHLNDGWHIVYEKDGHIHHRVRTDSGWLPAEPLTTGDPSSQNPHLAGGGSRLHVVWEDLRTGTTEVWTRYWDGSMWIAEECLTCDGPPSSMPVIAGDSYQAYVAWLEGVVPESQVQGRQFQGGSWQPREIISESPAFAFEPSIAHHPWTDMFTVVWTDLRNSLPQLYLRTRGFLLDGGPLIWSEEVALTEPGQTNRRPSIHAEWCCGDVVQVAAQVVFERESSGVTEVYGGCYEVDIPFTPVPMSALDGVSSAFPNVGGFAFFQSLCEPLFIIQTNNIFVTWTEEEIPGARTSVLRRYHGCPDNPAGDDTLTTIGVGSAAVAAIEGDPWAGIMTLWVEEVAGTPTLMSRRGRQLGYCEPVVDDPPSALLVAPEGIPSNVLRVVDSCTGGPSVGFAVYLDFDTEIANDLIWDTPYGVPPFVETTDSDGLAEFRLRGGGCSQAGDVNAMCNGVEFLHAWPGVRSPDVDGDCVVDPGDLAYVESQLGTGDFCADLDGSGEVDSADILIVTSTMGHRCSIVGVDNPGVPSLPHLQLAVRPNPARGDVHLHVELPDPGAVSIEVLDVTGRLVRDLGTRYVETGQTSLTWDMRDERGHEVASGTYFIRARHSGGLATRALRVVR